MRPGKGLLPLADTGRIAKSRLSSDMMLKRILTLFAILTGLAAVAAPAQARMSVLDGLELHAVGDNVVKCADKGVTQQAMPMERIGGGKPQAPGCRPAVITIVIPTVQLQADRTRE